MHPAMLWWIATAILVGTGLLTGTFTCWLLPWALLRAQWRRILGWIPTSRWLWPLP